MVEISLSGSERAPVGKLAGATRPCYRTPSCRGNLDTKFVMVTWTPNLSHNCRKGPALLVRPGGCRRCLAWPVRLSLSFRRLTCHVPSLSPFASRFFLRWQAHADPHDVALQFSLSLRTVQRLFARFARQGQGGIVRATPCAASCRPCKPRRSCSNRSLRPADSIPVGVRR